MRACVFVGPSAGDVVLPEGVDRFAPACLGSVWRAVEAGYDRIGLVDGLFGVVPAVWHKELLHALCRGVAVYGASSMGALRAAELDRYGMIGAGVIFRLYRAGCLMDDDEVCLVHAPKEAGFRPLSLPMVSIRRTLASMVRAAELSPAAAAATCAAMKQHHFSVRDLDTLGAAFDELATEAALLAFRRRYEDLKTLDYRAMLRVMARPLRRKATDLPPWNQLETAKWYVQFVEEPDNIPQLERW